MDALRNETNDIRGELRSVVDGFASMREQFEWMRARWEELERERKSKEKLGGSSPGENESKVVLGRGEEKDESRQRVMKVHGDPTAATTGWRCHYSKEMIRMDGFFEQNATSR